MLIPDAADIGDWTCAVTVRKPSGWQATSQLPPVTEVLAGTPAASSGIRRGDFVREVNERSVEDDPFALAHALVESTVKQAISLQVHRDGTWTTRAIAYDRGLLVPRFERSATVPDRLGDILAPRAALVKAPLQPIP